MTGSTKAEDAQLSALRRWIAEAAEAIDANLSVRLWNGETLPLGRDVTGPVVFVVNGPEAVRRMVFRPNLLTAVELFAEGVIDLEGGTPLDAAGCYDHMRVVRWGRALSKLRLARSLAPFLRESGSGTGVGAYARRIGRRFGRGREDRRMIAHHYDVGNAFYEQLLGPEMIYSPGYFADETMGLEAAERRKLEVICAKLRLRPGERMLDIGCGWGALACHAAREHGVHVLGVTLSEEQHAFATERVRREGLEDRVAIELKDYREVPAEGQFDKVSQVGMSEHLGLDNQAAHFQRVHDLLRPRGLHFHEAITRPVTPRPEDFRKPTVYQRIINRYIFPGGELDHIGLTCINMESHRLEVIDVENIREHYRRTCELWVERLWQNREAAVAVADWPRVRLWLFYLSMFAVGLDRGVCGTFQVVASRRKVGSSGLPMERRGSLEG